MSTQHEPLPESPRESLPGLSPRPLQEPLQGPLLESRRESLPNLLRAASAAGWAGPAAEHLAAAIEQRVVAEVPLRLRRALGSDEAWQRARVLAWERCRALAADPPRSGIEWGYLANHVRWRLADAMRAEALRAERHPVVAFPPDRPAPMAPIQSVSLGPRLERLADELSLAGLDPAMAYRLLRAAADGPRFERAYIAARLVQAGASERQADALAWLLRGGRGAESVLSRLARGERPELVFIESTVRRRIIRAATATCHTAAMPAAPAMTAMSGMSAMPRWGRTEPSKQVGRSSPGLSPAYNPGHNAA